MALADYYKRDAIAISQVLSGFNEQAIRQRLDAVRLGIAFSKDAASKREGNVLLDLLVRLAARLYPVLSLRPGIGGEDRAGELAALAQSINPSIELDEHSEPTITIFVGPGPDSLAGNVYYAGASGWTGLFSPSNARSLGRSANPVGAGTAACLALANVFRAVFQDSPQLVVDKELSLSGLPPGHGDLDPAGLDIGEVALVGVGAVGNSAIWTLKNLPVTGQLHLVDHQQVDLGNLQRYVLAERSDEGKAKVDVGANYLDTHLDPHAYQVTWAEFVQRQGHRQETVLVGLDSAADRRAVQASLPRWIINAWTQPGDLGVSDHRLDTEGACLACLYLPRGTAPNEDALYSEALRIPDRLMQVRILLYQEQSPPRELLQLVASRLGVEESLVLRFEGRPLRELYVEGICGGAILPLGYAGSPRADVHVPLAHQSALAGILAASRLVRGRAALPVTTTVTRINLMRPIETTEFLTQPAGKDPRGICLCQDADYVSAYRSKWRLA